MVAPKMVGELPTETTPPARVPLVRLQLQLRLASSVAGRKDLQVKPVEGGLKVSFSSRLMFKSGKALLEPSQQQGIDSVDRALKRLPHQPRPGRGAIPTTTGQ